MNSGGIARDSGGNTRDSGVNGRNEFFENTKIFFWLKWVRVEFGALGGILSFGQISCLNAFKLKLLPARRSRYIYIILCDIINIYIYIYIFPYVTKYRIFVSMIFQVPKTDSNNQIMYIYIYILYI